MSYGKNYFSFLKKQNKNTFMSSFDANVGLPDWRSWLIYFNTRKRRKHTSIDKMKAFQKKTTYVEEKSHPE